MDFKTLFAQIVREEEGQDLIEYALITGFIAVVCWVAIQATGVAINDMWEAVQAEVEAAAAAI